MTRRYPEPIEEFLGGEPTAEQWEAISMPLEPYVLVAGAGSGKTSVMAARVIHLAMVATGSSTAEHEGVLPGNVLCLTFTNKATENLIRRIRRALATLDLEEGEEPEILNYHGFAVRVLQRHGMLIDIEPDQRVLTPTQRAELAARVLDEMTFEHLHTRWQPSIIGYILDLDEQAMNHLVQPEEIVAHVEAKLDALERARSDEPIRAAEERMELAMAVARFRRLKRDLHAIDFGDQIALAERIVREHPQVGAEYRERFGAVLLDEYQDTNYAQAMLMAGLFGNGHPVTAVGDPDQNIYAWRGASLHNLLDFPNVFRRADGAPARKLPLYTNFRSGARILKAADEIIAPLPPEQRPDPTKELRPWEPNGVGEVSVAVYEHEIAEAEAISERIRSLHTDGLSWREVAVLCRTHRQFEPLRIAFDARGVPAEFIGLTGLIRMPEVVEVLAYARAAADPEASVSLARILLGPRYRVGHRDLARVAAWTKRSEHALRERLREERASEDDDLFEDEPFLIAEALEHLDEVEGLSEEGRARLEAFAGELEELRDAARRPVGEFLAHVIRQIGLLTELDADLDTATSAAKRRNLAAFLDQVHAFEPLDSELDLGTFLDHIDAMEEDREWIPVQPSEDDTVKVMTVHAAKGLEFDTVFVPGLAEGLFPDPRVQQNPAKHGRSLDVELRSDRKLLPVFDGVMSRFQAELRDRELFEERRTCYVALTRAKSRLFTSSAVWYGERLRARNVGTFLVQLKRWAEQSGLADVTVQGSDAEENPLAGYRQSLVPPWPGPALPDETDELFPDGWRRAAREAHDAGRVPPAILGALDDGERARYESLAEQNRTAAENLVEREGRDVNTPWLPPTISVGGVIDYARCPKRFYWSVVRPLPRFSGPAARLGTDVHRWIERRSSGQASLLEPEATPDLSLEESAGEPGRIERLRQAFLDSRFATMTPLYAERPFILGVDRFRISGRIDAIYGEPLGHWEVVDYKTGAPPRADDPAAGLQLDLYALACVNVWHKAPDELRLTYLYLSTGEEIPREVRDPDRVRSDLLERLEQMAAAAFDPVPDAWCRYCDFLPFCDAGQAYPGGTAEG